MTMDSNDILKLRFTFYNSQLRVDLMEIGSYLPDIDTQTSSESECNDC